MGFDTKCTNHDERFTCPGCYADLPYFLGVQICAECNERVRCFKESIPQFCAAIVGSDDDPEDEDEDEDNEEDEDDDE